MLNQNSKIFKQWHTKRIQLIKSPTTMNEIFNLISTLIYFLVGIICLFMAYKSIFSKKFLPFHEEAAGTSWESIDARLQNVIITILRISGLGFLTIFLILAVFSIINYFKPDPVIKFSIPAISLIYCFGLFLFNFQLFKQTKAKTPWLGSLIAMIMILAGFIISIL